MNTFDREFNDWLFFGGSFQDMLNSMMKGKDVKLPTGYKYEVEHDCHTTSEDSCDGCPVKI